MNEKETIEKVSRFINKNGLLTKEDKLLVGLSGGPDSIALTLILQKLGYNISAAHCNFHLRGAESDRDQHFVEQFCQQKGIELFIKNFETKEYSVQKRVSIEVAARELRYNWFRKLIDEKKFSCLAIAHHQDDSNETFLINLSRGTGIHGLCGIRANEKIVKRPILCLNRQEIQNFLENAKQPTVTDSTNLENIFTRNRFRNVIIPEIEKIRPAFKKNLQKTIENICECEAFVNEQIGQIEKKIEKKRENGDTIIDLSLIHESNNYHFILHEILRKWNFNTDVVFRLSKCDLLSSGQSFSNANFRLDKNRNHIYISQITDKSGEVSCQEYTIRSINDTNALPINLHIENKPLPFFPVKDKKICHIDGDKIEFPLRLRHWKDGDSFYPFGLDVRKKLSDFFINEKIANGKKHKVWILTTNKGEIVWIVGIRSDNRFRITEQTKTVLEIKEIGVSI